jgi:hypothetical protein
VHALVVLGLDLAIKALGTMATFFAALRLEDLATRGEASLMMNRTFARGYLCHADRGPVLGPLELINVKIAPICTSRPDAR